MQHLHPNQLLTAALLAMAPAMAPVVPVFAQETPDQWTIVLIGDSWLPDTVRFYVERTETDFGVEAFYTPRNTSLLQHADKMLRSGAWDVVRDAEVVVVGISVMNDRPGYCTTQPGDTPIHWPLEAVPPMIDGFLQALAERVDANTQLVRIALEDLVPDDLARWTENDHLTECMGVQTSVNAAWAAGAEAHGFTLVDFYTAWNGPDGKAQPPRTYYMPDGRHFSPEGAKAAADLLVATGYQPLEK